MTGFDYGWRRLPPGPFRPFDIDSQLVNNDDR
jgi:hypothetical protein